MVIKAVGNVAMKDPQTSGLAENLDIVTFIKSDNKEKDEKYGRYAASREERNLRTKALGWYFSEFQGKGMSGPEPQHQ